MATARRSPVGFVDVPGNGLDAFECEVSAAPPLLEMVDAYPEPMAVAPVGAGRTKASVTLRRLLWSVLHGIRAVAVFPFVVVAWLTLRIWWTIRLAVSGTWRLVTSAVMAIVLATRAFLYGIGHAIGFVGSSIARSGVRTGAQALSRVSLRIGRPTWVRAVPIRPAFAVVLSLVAGISTGAVMLVLSQRDAPRVAGPAPSPPLRAAVVAAPLPAAVLPAAVLPAVARAPIDRSPARRRAVVPAATPPTRTAVTRAPSVPVASITPMPDASPSISAATVRAVWSQTDTRSLDRALTALRSVTLAFRRCEMRMTSDDRAVARCEEAGGGAPGSPADVAWTIDFRRDEGRWLIDGLFSSGGQTGSNR